MEGLAFGYDYRDHRPNTQIDTPAQSPQDALFGMGAQMSRALTYFTTHPTTETNLRTITKIAVSSITSGTLASYRLKAHPKLLKLTQILITLHNALTEASDKRGILQALDESIHSLKIISKLSPPNFDRIFLVRSEAGIFAPIQNPQRAELIEEVTAVTGALVTYQRVLTGEEKSPKTIEELTTLREGVIRVLAGNPNYTEYDEYAANLTLPEAPVGFLTKLLKYIADREGVIATGVRESVNNFIESLIGRVTSPFHSPHDNVDLPPYQLLNGREVRNFSISSRAILAIKELWNKIRALIA